jgi:translocation and assembly module TamA
VFLDGGRTFDHAVPDSLSGLFWGTGVGLRYYTPIGPIRLDVAFPLNPRQSIDDSFQLYVSIGQAF